jgi:hypothetical protein
MEFFQPIGDAIANLQVDSNGKKPDNMSAFFNIMEKLSQSKDDGKDAKKENYDAASASSTASAKTMISCLKPAAVITAAAMIMMIPQVNEAFVKMFPKPHLRYGLMALIILVVAMVAIKKF